MFRRPKVGETEEDLLKQEEEFLKQSGKVPTRERNLEVKPVKKVKRKSVKVSRIVGDVIERNQTFLNTSTDVSEVKEKGFPSTFEIDLNISPGKRGKKSLFALHMEKKNKKSISQNVSMEIDVPEPSAEEIETIDESGMSCEDTVNSTERLKNKDLSYDVKESIHKESLDKLSEMSEAEILEAQKQLHETLDPKLIALLKNRSKSKEKTEIKDQPRPQEVEMEDDSNADDSNAYEDQKIKETLRSYVGERWMNMAFLEKEKLEWVGDIPSSKSLEPDQPYSARFNFRGELQPFTTEIDVTSALYHHGEEPERPGYTIQELYKLTRSAVPQQRIFALNALANIIRKTKMGHYDSCFDGYLLQKLLDSELFLLLRFSLDENILIPVTINCIRRLIYDESDEYCLDRLLGITDDDVQPLIFDTIEADKDEEKELTDHAIIHSDLIKGVLRTDFLHRIAYILNTLEWDEETMSNAVLCCIRISRHSIESCRQIINNVELLNCIYSCMNCMYPIYQGIKLFRLLSGLSKEITADLASRYHMGFLIPFLDMETMRELTKRELYLLKLECIYLWRNFLRFGFMIDYFISWTPCFVRLLHFYCEQINIDDERDFDFEMFSALMSLLRVCVREKLPIDRNYTNAIKTCLEKWMRQLLQFKNFTYGGMKALGSCFAFFVEYLKIFEIDEKVLSFIQKTNEIISSLISSPAFDTLASTIVDYSHLLIATEIKRNPSNLPSLCSVYENGHDFLKIVNNRCALPFFINFVKYLKSSYDISPESKNNIEMFLNCPSIRRYVTEVINLSGNLGNWFEKYELLLLTDILHLSYITSYDLGLKLGFRLLPMTRVDGENFKLALSVLTHKKTWSSDEEFFRNLSDVYLEHIHKPSDDFKLVLRYKNERVGEDWMYRILSLLRGKEAVAEVGKVLKFISFVMKHNPELLQRVPYNLRYYHLCAVFLTDENVFDNEIQEEMRNNLSFVLCNREKVNLDKKVDEKKSFYDLYTELITQYAGVSYGLHIFAEFVLFPLLNRFDVSFRKLLWFEYLHVLRVITLPYPATDFIDVKEFSEPCETDESLLVAYLNSVSKNVIVKNRNPFVYNIAVSNIKNYMKSDNKDSKLYNFLSQKISLIKNETTRQDLMV